MLLWSTRPCRTPCRTRDSRPSPRFRSHLSLVRLRPGSFTIARARHLIFPPDTTRCLSPIAQVEEGDGYAAALVNFRFTANTVWTTEQAVKAMQAE